MLKEKTVEIEGLTITVREADLRAGFHRARLQGELIYNAHLDQHDPDLANVYLVYADLVAGTSSVEGMEWPLLPDAFCQLSDAWFDRVGYAWLGAVREVNPHWAPAMMEAVQGETQAAVE